MKKKTLVLKKLSLHKEAITALAAGQQAAVQGGASAPYCVMITRDVPCTVQLTCRLTCGPICVTYKYGCN